MDNGAIVYNSKIIDIDIKKNKIMETKRRVYDMKVLLNRIYKEDDQYMLYNELFKQGLSFSGKSILKKDGGILFI